MGLVADVGDFRFAVAGATFPNLEQSACFDEIPEFAGPVAFRCDAVMGFEDISHGAEVSPSVAVGRVVDRGA